MLLHIYSSPTLVSDIRREISPYVAATQPPNVFGIAEPPRLMITNVDDLLDVCPLLKAVFCETLRLHSMPLSVRKVTKTFSASHFSSIEPRDPTVQQYEIKSGAFLVAACGLQGQGSVMHAFDETFDARKSLSVDQEGKQRSSDAAGHPWGVGQGACPGRIFAEKQVLSFVAAIVSLWDIEPADLGTWKMPKSDGRHVLAGPKKDCRMLLRARKLDSKDI